MSEKILVSGVKPTGRPHIGNYLGAMRQFVDLQHEYETRVFIADLHALNTTHDRDELYTASLDIAMDYLAIGLDPEKVLLYKQSSVPEVTELSWIFNTLTPVSLLGKQAHATKSSLNLTATQMSAEIVSDFIKEEGEGIDFKKPDLKEVLEKKLSASFFEKLKEEGFEKINVGTFCYPLLMAADILIHDADVVPVGQDQKQHIEIARDTAEKFNNAYGETFKLPKELIVENTATVPGTDGQKMSKSYGNTIPLFATEEEITKAVMSIATDSKSPEEPKDTEGDTLYTLHTLFTTGDDLEKVKEGYAKGGLGYKESKDILIKHIDTLVAPLREKRFEIAKDVDAVKAILEEGGKKAQEITQQKMELVRKQVGLSI